MLEIEPAASANFFIASRPPAPPSTIPSLCRMVGFSPLVCRGMLKRLFQSQKFAPDDAELSAKLAAGSIGRALLTDVDQFRQQREIMLKVLESLTGQKNIAALLRAAEEINDAKNKDHYGNFLQILQNLI